jgi:uncharacterized cupredoxin-like copper-binding protein
MNANAVPAPTMISGPARLARKCPLTGIRVAQITPPPINVIPTAITTFAPPCRRGRLAVLYGPNPPDYRAQTSARSGCDGTPIGSRSPQTTPPVTRSAMSTTKDPPTHSAPQSLRDELHQLEAEEEQLETRTRRLEMSNPFALLFSIVACALALGAFIVALSNNNNTPGSVGASAAGAAPGSSSAATSMPMGGSMGSTGMMMGAGGHGGFTKAQVAAASHGTVYVQLGDFWAAPAVDTVRAGKVTFLAKNVGQYLHELMIERAPVKMSAPGQPIEDAAQGMVNDMKPGQSGHMTLTLKPGKYVLFCNVTGHYAAGQHIPFTVTK